MRAGDTFVLCCKSSATVVILIADWRARGAGPIPDPGPQLTGSNTSFLRPQEDAQVGTGLQRVLSTSAGHSLSPAALAELRSIAAAKSPSVDGLASAIKPRASAAVGTAGLTEMATILEAKHDSPAKAAHHNSAIEHAQLLLAPGLPPLRATLPAPQPSASSAVISHGTAAGAAQPGCTSTAANMTPSDRGSPTLPFDESASKAATRGLPGLNTRSKREARRRLAFQPPNADRAVDGNADGTETLRRTLAVPSDLATLAAGGSRPVRSRLSIHVIHPSTPFTCTACFPRQSHRGVRPYHVLACTRVKPCSSITVCPYLQILYRTTSCSDVIGTTASPSVDSSPQRLEGLASQQSPLAAMVASSGHAPTLSQLPDSAAEDTKVRPSGDSPAQIRQPHRKLSSAAEALLVATSAGTASEPAQHHSSNAVGPLAPGGAEALRPALQLAMPSVSTAAPAVQQRPAADAEPGTPTGAGASTEPPEEQGSGESYNSQQGFGSPVRKRHGALPRVCDSGGRIAFRASGVVRIGFEGQ